MVYVAKRNSFNLSTEFINGSNNNHRIKNNKMKKQTCMHLVPRIIYSFKLTLALSGALILGGQFFVTDALAQWSSDSTINNHICTTSRQQGAERVVSDGHGGAIIAWWDLDLTTSNYNIYAQRIDSAGILQWVDSGVVICANPLLQQNPEMTSDNHGGAIIVWQDNRSGNCEIYAQRINGSGVVQWTADGVSVGNATNCQTFPQVISDSSDGAIVTWKDLRNGTSYRIYAQHINGNGINQWGSGGVAMSTGTNEQGEPQIISDANNGSIICWQEYVGSQYDVYAQRLNSGGAILWGVNGSVICSAANFQQRSHLTTDGANGAIIIWEDSRTGAGTSSYAQRVNGSGVVQWAPDGVQIGPAAVSGVAQSVQRIVSDSSGGAFITWRNGNNEVYGQHISTGGSLIWGATGLQIISQSNANEPQVINDGGSGAIIAWYDFRGSGNGDIIAQHVDSGGAILWAVNGVGVCRNSFGQSGARLVGDGSGGAILTWQDERDFAVNSVDIYASKLNNNGTLGVATGVNDIAIDNSLLIYPNPLTNELSVNGTMQNGMIRIFDVSGKEILKQKSSDVSTKINTEKLLAGFYLISYTQEDKTLITKLVKY